ncbi:hypothetical protein J7E88_06190 [Streptomyces sp. ISL-10]|uniref:hypothetical protein n=1 Tax=Streptomyces sp. ISL-10 TaxID=2819172 RepID=UPI001BE6C50D|nr:hypothetical protein [Streptomyces sp. ISL-10]MBT2364922.1 hypothetical protein [Streptomyces sp. ISL-10]
MVEKALAAEHADKGVDFIVALVHQAAFSSSSRHGADDGVRETWLPAVARYSVDLVLQGHDHNYERSHVLAGNQVVAGVPDKLDSAPGTSCAATAARCRTRSTPVQPAWAAFRQALKIGTLKVEVDPLTPNGMSRLTLGDYWALDGSPIEEGIVLEKNARSAPRQDDAAGTTPQSAAPASTPTSADAPAGTMLIGVVPAGARGLAMHVRTREEALDERASLT